MKKFYLTVITTLFCLFFTYGGKAQNTQTKLDQLKLVQNFLGTWQQNLGKDTVEVSETHQYGKAIVNTVFLVINSKKSFSYIEDYGFSQKEGKFKGFILYSSGDYATWIASFTSEKKFSGDFVRDFNPGTVISKFECVIESPTSFVITLFNTNGVKTGNYKYSKVK